MPELSSEQREWREVVRDFAQREVSPAAAKWDREAEIPRSTISSLAKRGYLGALLPRDIGGLQCDMVSLGILHEEIGRACSSLRSLLTVHGMVGHTISRWGTPDHKAKWLPKLSNGESIAALALTEPTVGSDAGSVETSAVRDRDFYLLNGSKCWISFAQIATLFLVIGTVDGKPTAFLVDRDSPGLTIEPMSGLLGLRASMLGRLSFENCQIPAENLLGRVGLGFSHVAGTALDLGRYTVAWGCVGIGQGCLEASMSYAHERKQFGKRLNEHELVQRMLTRMIVGVRAARLLCLEAGLERDAKAASAMVTTSMAKYFAAKTAGEAASDAVQIHGANGCADTYPVERYLRDSKIMEIIEGSTQMQEIMIAQNTRLPVARRPERA